jgi:hypothetical protein
MADELADPGFLFVQEELRLIRLELATLNEILRDLASQKKQ